MQVQELTDYIIANLEDSKAVDIDSIDVASLTDIMDVIVICTATSTRHSTAIATKLIDKLKEIDLKPYGVEGDEPGDWIVIDCYDVVVHIMLADIRDFYGLEKLWAINAAKQAEQ